MATLWYDLMLGAWAAGHYEFLRLFSLFFPCSFKIGQKGTRRYQIDHHHKDFPTLTVRKKHFLLLRIRMNHSCQIRNHLLPSGLWTERDWNVHSATVPYKSLDACCVFWQKDGTCVMQTLCRAQICRDWVHRVPQRTSLEVMISSSTFVSVPWYLGQCGLPIVNIALY
jgi:hypothetical protein